MSKPKLVRISVGTRVKIIRQVEKAPKWRDIWVESMTENIGKTGTVVSTAHGGYNVDVGGKEWYFNYPRAALRVIRK